MACPCTVVDVDAIAEAYYALLQVQEEPVVSDETEETTTVYWTGDPDAVSTSVGSYDNLVIKNGKIVVPISVAVYLTSTQPSLFSPVQPKSAPSAPAKIAQDKAEE